MCFISFHISWATKNSDNRWIFFLQLNFIVPNYFLRISKLGSEVSKFRQSGVPTRDSLSRRILKVCALSRVKAWFWNRKIVFSRSMNTSPVRTRSNTIVHTRILIHFMTIFYQNASIFIFASKFYKKTNKARIVKAEF